MKIFFISPVRQATEEIKKWCEEYVEKMEKEGNDVHWPIRNTDQNDVIGINICDTNLNEIFERPRIDVYYLNSTGIHFDLGAAYMLISLGYEKEINFLKGNKKKFEKKYASKELLESILQSGTICIEYSKEDMALHFLLGAIYMLIRILGYKKEIVFTNKDDFKEEFICENGEFISKDGKSFLNVLNYLDKTTPVTIEKLQKILRKCWSKETSADPERWAPENPSWGQCAITALIVQDYFGGKLIRGEAKLDGNPISHYWNRLAVKDDIDLTKEQFPQGTEISELMIRDRKYVLSFEPTRKRYDLLKKAVENEEKENVE